MIAAYERQLAAVQAAGSRVILMASRALARVAASPDDYRETYRRVLAQAAEPVILRDDLSEGVISVPAWP